MLDNITRIPAGLRPPAPAPRAKFPGPIALLRVLIQNPLEAWCQDHFERLVLPLRMLGRRVALVSEPGAIRRVLVENAGNYHKDFLQQRVLSAGLSDGLLAAEGERWRVQRRALAPMFARKSVTDFAPIMMRAADALSRRWRSLADGAVVDVAAEAGHLTLDVLEQTIFSDGLGRDPDEMRLAMDVYFEMIGRIDPFDVIGLPNFIPRLTRFSGRSACRFFDATVDETIARRRHRLAEDPARVPRDLLTLLLEAVDPESRKGMNEDEVKANVLTFIAAGQETTTNALTWSIFLLSQAPDWRQRVADEARRETRGPVESLSERLVVTRSVIDEAMRLYPPIAAISRAALGPDELAGQRIERGTIIVIAPYVLHRHRALWPQPDMFDPNRFLGNARAAIDRFAYLPFGAGPRICIGSTFALQEATLALAILMRDFSLDVAPGHIVWPVQRVTLRPRNGLPMVIRRSWA